MFTRIVKYSIAKSLRLQQIWNDFVDTHSITSKVENSIKIMFMILDEVVHTSVALNTKMVFSPSDVVRLSLSLSL